MRCLRRFEKIVNQSKHMPKQKQNKKINIEVELDEHNVPENIKWSATDLEGYDEASCRAMLLSLWDHDRKDTLRLDLWTRKMTVDEMKIFFHQTLVTMADTLEKSINDPRISGDMRDFCDYFAERMEISS
jgi:gliding motility-associated protein GldC